MVKHMANKQTHIQRYVQERIELIAIAEDRDKQEASKQGVSIRLDPGKVRVIDYMAKQLDVSRQGLLLELVNTSLLELVQAYADTFGKDAQKVGQDIWTMGNITVEDL